MHQSQFLFAYQQLNKHEVSSEMIQKKLQQLIMKLKTHLKNKLGKTFIASSYSGLIHVIFKHYDFNDYISVSASIKSCLTQVYFQS